MIHWKFSSKCKKTKTCLDWCAEPSDTRQAFGASPPSRSSAGGRSRHGLDLALQTEPTVSDTEPSGQCVSGNTS